MQVGDYIAQDFEAHSQYGEVTEVEGDTITWVELYAAHRVWGGSNGGRGETHTSPISELRAKLSGTERGVVKDCAKTYHKNPDKWTGR